MGRIKCENRDLIEIEIRLEKMQAQCRDVRLFFRARFFSGVDAGFAADFLEED